jgi:hypothetical protein
MSKVSINILPSENDSHKVVTLSISDKALRTILDASKYVHSGENREELNLDMLQHSHLLLTALLDVVSGRLESVFMEHYSLEIHCEK